MPLGRASDQIYQVTVEIKDRAAKERTSYIIRKWSTNNNIFPLGRGTSINKHLRWFKAYDYQTSWRATIPRYVPGAPWQGCSLYPYIHHCGRCSMMYQGLVIVMTTETRPRVHYHNRLVLGYVGDPLKSFLLTWELVSAPVRWICSSPGFGMQRQKLRSCTGIGKHHDNHWERTECELSKSYWQKRFVDCTEWRKNSDFMLLNLCRKKPSSSFLQGYLCKLLECTISILSRSFTC